MTIATTEPAPTNDSIAYTNVHVKYYVVSMHRVFTVTIVVAGKPHVFPLLLLE